MSNERTGNESMFIHKRGKVRENKIGSR